MRSAVVFFPALFTPCSTIKIGCIVDELVVALGVALEGASALLLARGCLGSRLASASALRRGRPALRGLLRGRLPGRARRLATRRAPRGRGARLARRLVLFDLDRAVARAACDRHRTLRLLDQLIAVHGDADELADAGSVLTDQGDEIPSRETRGL